MEEIDLKDLFKYILSKCYIIIILFIVAIGFSFIYREFFKVPLYESYTTVVLTRNETSMETDGTITQNDIALNQKLISTYREIIKSRRVLDQVIDAYSLNATSEELGERITVASESDTDLIRISVYDEDSEMAKNIANKIAKVFSEEIVEIYSIKNISVIDPAIENDIAFNINPLKETAIYGIAGLAIGFFIVFMMFYFDTSIKSSEEIEQKLGLTVLGKVPKSHFQGGNK